jgi:putative tryptophan/tyrosine transport system substrate-binding protein
VIVTDSTSGTLAAFGATRTIPIVMATTGGDPVALGLASSIARPGGNVTGMRYRSFELSGRRLQLLRDAVPTTARVTVLVNPTTAIGPPGQRATEDAAKLLGIAITSLSVSNPSELGALKPAVLKGSDGLTIVNDAMFWNNRATILALRHIFPGRSTGQRDVLVLVDSVDLSRDDPIGATSAGVTA